MTFGTSSSFGPLSLEEVRELLAGRSRSMSWEKEASKHETDELGEPEFDLFDQMLLGTSSSWILTTCKTLSAANRRLIRGRIRVEWPLPQFPVRVGRGTIE